jgi:hypothetical protein
MKHKLAARSSLAVTCRCLLMGVGMSAVSIAASAQEKQAEPVPSSQAEPQKVVMVQSMKVGEATHKLLDIQARGLMASNRQYPVPVAVAERIYQRYLASFEHPIAENSGSALDAIE